MHTTSCIRRHLLRLPVQILFTTREFLIYGSRSAVDQALSRLTKKGHIVRLARGVFMRAAHNLSSISTFDVAKAKAQAFGKRLAVCGLHIAQELGLAPDTKLQQTFYVDGSSSTFQFGDITIFLKKTCARKVRLSNTAGGKALRALWDLGKWQVGPTEISQAISRCGRSDRQEIRLSLSWIPGWLNAHFLDFTLPHATFHHYPHPFASLP